MEILQDEDDRTVRREPLQEPRGELEKSRGAVLTERTAVRLPQLGQDPGQFVLPALGRRDQLVGQLAAQGAQNGGEGRERESARADFDASESRDDGPFRAGRLTQLLDEPALADPGLTADEERLRLARATGGRRGASGGGAGERFGERREFAGPTDEHRADGPGFHRPEHRTGV